MAELRKYRATEIAHALSKLASARIDEPRKTALRLINTYRMWIVAGVVVVPTVWAIAGLQPGNAPAFALFIGRFHPSLVHFPIGFLFLAALMEIVAARSPQLGGIRAAVPFVLALGALASIVAVLAGYLLSLGSDYDVNALDRHMWLGYLVAIGACAGFLLERLSSRKRRFVTVYRGVLAGTAALVLVAGHFGGTLTRGEGYLTYYLPEPLKRFAGMAVRNEGLIANIDSALVYQDLVAPVLERRCVKCHGASKAEEDLRLDKPEHIASGGDGGPIITPGRPDDSELLRRATLPPYHEDVMPPDGEAPMTVVETELIRWWIANGASFDARVGDVKDVPSSVAVHLRRIAAPRDPKRQGIFALTVEDPDTAAIATLRRMGIGVRVLLDEAPFIDVTTTNVRDRIGNEALEQLIPLEKQVTWLDLSATKVSDSGLSTLAAMKNLTRLHLQQTAVSDSGLVYLGGLSRLEYLNLYGTRVSDAGLEHLKSLTSLRTLYVWQTGVTEAGISRLLEHLPKLQINAGSTLAEADLPEVGQE